MIKDKLPSSFFNPVSILGAIIAAIASITLIFLVIMTKTSAVYNVYMDVFIYIVVPFFLFMGLVLISAGMIWKRRGQKRGTAASEKSVFIFNLKEPKTRNSLIIFGTVTILFIMSTIIGTYETFHYTESNEFCGKLCHKVMLPEYTAYQLSPHARVNCVDCHIGNGVNWFVKAKVSGIRQVFHYLGSNYPRPIGTPLEGLRPAKETCEKCHWPQKIYSHKLNHFKYFLRDSANTEWDIAMDMKLGPSTKISGTSRGIHWHDDPGVEVLYKANAKHDTIYWVKYLNKKTGVEKIYEDEETKKSEAELALIPTRTMDCMDCHNRPAHEYRSPSFYLNNLFSTGKLSTSIPWLKKVAMDALKNKFSTTDSALTEIRNRMRKKYQNKYPLVFQTYEKQIDSAATIITNEYLANAYPEMNINFREYPRNIGHLESDGCFRCHNDKHKTADGKKITKDCYNCHDFLKQGTLDKMSFCDINNSVKWLHPVELEEDWEKCSECH